MAVSAFLIFGRAYWPPLFLALFLTRVLLDVTLRHTLETSLALSVISLTNALAVAWCVRHFAAGAIGCAASASGCWRRWAPA
ncbi:Uncharacterised protein [Serratia rubidaea]|uniref:Uncharacterized protein n=1 Tax=Serratia rubidaea TaxID=61652 RepID=A0A3S4JQD0_SERRU|nr:Uncharacterised protein [Serratia rubidaea]